MAEVTAALAAESVVREFGEGESAVRAVNEVTISISPGEFVALVGRSGVRQDHSDESAGGT